MPRTGRRPQGVGLVQPLSGSELAKRRMTLFLQTLAGEISVGEACAELQVGESRFYGLRAQWLQQALALLEPRPAGRPAHPPATVTPAEVEALRERLRESEARATALAVQAELAGALRPRARACAPLKKTPLAANPPDRPAAPARTSQPPAPPST